MRLLLLGEKLIAFRDSVGPGRRHGSAARIAAPRCSSAATRKTACAASITAGSSTPTAIASTCRTSRPSSDFKHHVKAKAYKPPSATALSGSIWASARRRRRCRRSRRPCCPDERVTIICVQRECNWLQALEGDIDTCHFGFLHAGSIEPECRPTTAAALHRDQPRAAIRRRPTPTGHDVRRLSRRQCRARPTGASPISCCRSGPRRRRAVRRPSCTTAPGSRWTTPTRCSVSLTWKRHAPSLGRTRTATRCRASAGLRISAQHHRLVRPLAAYPQRGQRLADRPRGAGARRQLHRHQRHPRAGSGGHRKHGADHRPLSEHLGPAT